MKASKKAALCAVLAILLTAWTLFIFSNSLKTREESSSSSRKVARVVKAVVDPKNKMPEISFHNGVRKAAHVAEFCVQGMLAVALASLLYTKKGTKRKSFLFAMPPAVCMLTATGDEYLQIHTGRGAAFTDVLIDTGGAAMGIILLTAVVWIVRNWRIVKQM